jgi:hypothetical protein
MSERRAALLILGTAVLSAACGHPEQRIVDQYFNALRANDQQTVTSFSMVNFDQKVDAWKITGTAPETRGPATLADLARKVSEQEAELAANKKTAGAYANDHYADIDRVKEAQKAGKPVPGNLAAVADAWTKFNDKDRDLKRQVADAKAAVEKEKRNVSLSVGQQDDLEKLKGEVVEKQIDLDLTIGGEVKPYSMVLRKYELTGGTGPRIVSRWVVEQLKPRG